MKHKQHGFAVIELLIVVVVLVIIGGAGYYVYSKNSDNKSAETSAPAVEKTETKDTAKIKNIGVNIDYYNPKTHKAGDFVFTMADVFADQIFINYGHLIPASPDFPAKRNPQPTYHLPLGTKVRALVDGKVVDVPKLYSGDYSVMVQPEGSDLVFETEHVVNVKVKKGDRVKAGEVVAEVSPFDSEKQGGLGLIEIGILKGGNKPTHVCPFDYLDESVKDDILKKITALQREWEKYRGDSNIYDESKIVTPGCYTHKPIEG